jgi:putative nucleotidyltransferase with HDIG domain
VSAWYRARQFWHALIAKPAPQDLLQAGQVLSPALMALFLRLQASEQAHSLWIFQQLRTQNPDVHTDLLAAALLHDVGKSRYPLRAWERVLIVLAKAVSPRQVERWGQAEPRGWKRSFVVAAQHPAWGAEMAAQAGASERVAAIIRRHQDTRLQPGGELEDIFLYQLKLLDDES